jgi:large subunit ribosomal protein L30
MSRLRVTLVKSGINKPQTQQKTLQSLGLTRPHSTVVCSNTSSMRGMIKKVIHLLKVEEVADEPAGS